VITIKGLKVELGSFALQGIDLDIGIGEYFIVLGPTGSGKTVLLEAIAGLRPVAEGTVSVNGREITKLEPEKRGIGIVYQDQVLFPHLSVKENIAFGLKLRKCAKGDIGLRIEKIACITAIDHLLERRPSTLSGGERQKVALARALVIEPELLLLDEPLTALDPETRERMQQELAEIHRRLNVTIIHVTHDFEEAISLGERVAVLCKGKIVQVGSPEDIMRRPNSEFVANFAQCRNIFCGEAIDVNVVDVDGTRLRTASTLLGKVHLSLRPEDILISSELVRLAAGNALEGTITDVVDRGSLLHVRVHVPPEFVCLITRQALEELGLRIGTKVWIAFKESAIHVFQ
jgi:ABC-type Fe3+/spermidine/putrescine transport system ATPase subunit